MIYNTRAHFREPHVSDFSKRSKHVRLEYGIQRIFEASCHLMSTLMLRSSHPRFLQTSKDSRVTGRQTTIGMCANAHTKT